MARHLLPVVLAAVVSGCGGTRRTATTGMDRPGHDRRSSIHSPGMDAERVAASASAGAKLLDCLNPAFLRVATDRFHGRSGLQAIEQMVSSCYRSYAQALDAPPPIGEGDLYTVLGLAIDRQQAMHTSLDSLNHLLIASGSGFTPAEPGTTTFSHHWDLGREEGLSLTTRGGATLFAYPLYPGTTASYMARDRNDEAANILFINQHMIIFIAPGETPGSGFLAAWRNIFSEPVNITSLVKGCTDALLFENHYIMIEGDGGLDSDRLVSLMARFSVPAIVLVDPENFTALIFTGTTPKTPDSLLNRLLK